METEFLGVPIYDNDIYKLLARFAINLVVLTVIVQHVYYRNARNKDYLFSYFMVNLIVFFICFTLKKFELELGMAIGLFAIFGILRYRTDAIPIKEMTYLFVVIGVAVINALANQKMSYLELAFTNLSIIGIAAILESIRLFKLELRERVLYEKIDLVRPENHAELVADLQQRTGLRLSRIEMGRIDFLRDTISIDLFYYPQDQEQSMHDGVEVSMRVQKD